MALSGFPDAIEVTLGSAWSGSRPAGAPLSAGDVLTLIRVGSSDVWTEDGSETPSNANRLRFAPADGGGLAGVNLSAYGGGIWYYLGADSHSTGGAYTFRNLWRTDTGGYTATAYWGGGYGAGFFTAYGVSYHSGIFSSLEAGSITIDAGVTATAPAQTASAAATAGRSASVAAAAPAQTARASANAATTHTASVAGTAPPQTASASAAAGRNASVAATAPAQSASASLFAGKAGDIAGVSPAQTASASARAGRSAALAATAPPQTASAAAAAGRSAALAATAPPQTASAAGVSAVAGRSASMVASSPAQTAGVAVRTSRLAVALAATAPAQTAGLSGGRVRRVSRADSPAGWLVICNANDAESQAWGSWYADFHAIPATHILAASLPAGEQMTVSEVEGLRAAVSDHLADEGIEWEIVGLVLGYGVPGRTDERRSVAGLMHRIDAPTEEGANPHYAGGAYEPDALPSRDAGLASGEYLVGEVSAPDLAAAEALTDRAAALSQIDATGRRFSTLDPAVDRLHAAETSGGWSDLDEWRGSLAAQRVRLPPGAGGGDAIELTDAASLALGETPSGGRRAILLTSAAGAAGTVR